MKTVNRNLLLLGIPALLVLAAGIGLFAAGNQLLDAASSLVPDSSSGAVGDVEGYALLIGLAGAGFSGLAGLMAQVLALAAMLYGGALLVLNAAARLLYRNTPGRILAYRIVMGVQFAVLILPAPGLLELWQSSWKSGGFSPVWPLCLAAIAVLAVLGCRNTYTDRLRKD